MKVALYRHYAKDGTLLYAGVSSNPPRRTRDHERTSSWAQDVVTITIEWFEDRAAALKAEGLVIAQDRPRNNRRSSGSGIKFYAEKGACSYCDRRRAYARDAMKRSRTKPAT